MKLPLDAIIAPEKLTRYLLIKQKHNDNHNGWLQPAILLRTGKFWKTICVHKFYRLTLYQLNQVHLGNPMKLQVI